VHERAFAAAVLALLVTARPSDACGQVLPQAEREPVYLAVGAHLGGAYRADDPPAFEPVARGGLTLGASVLAWIQSWIAVGLAYEHTDLGRERSGVGAFGLLQVERDLSTLWATLRVAPVSSDAMALYLVLGPGLSWQSADATGLVYTGPFGSAPVGITCEGSDSFDLALRGGAGIEGRIGTPGLVVFAEVSGDAHRLSSDPMGTCVPGAGSAMLIGARAGAAYRFDVTRLVR
jgi:hypothetical protein